MISVHVDHRNLLRVEATRLRVRGNQEMQYIAEFRLLA
jgi:hypothetical protein